MARHTLNARIDRTRSKSKVKDTLKDTKRPPRTPLTGPLRLAQQEGVVCSIGPHSGGDARIVRNWYTFPITPESIGPASAGLWTDTQIVGFGEAGSFGGRGLDSLSFSGVLEPPRFYYGTVRPPELERRFPGASWGGIDELEMRRFVMRSTIPPDPAYTNTSPGVPPLRNPQTGGPFDRGVVTEDGAHAGPNQFMDPHAFRQMLEDACKAGEIVHIVLGEDYGWNHECSIREFAWRFEDPDPDVLYFDIALREHRERKLLGVKNTKKPKKPVISTKAGDTLRSIAIREWGDPTKWKFIHGLNKSTISGLWRYPKSGDQPESIGHKVKGREKGHVVGSKKKKGVKGGKFDYFDVGADDKFRKGVRLRVMKRKRGADKPGGLKGSRNNK